MNSSSTCDRIEFKLYAVSAAEEMTKLLAEVFPRHDPLAMAPGLTPADFELFVRTLLPQAADEGLTIVARLAETGEMVGAMLTNDPARERDQGMETLSERFGPIGSILGELATTYRAGRESRPGEMLHLYLLGVSDCVVGKGVAQQLVAASVEMAHAEASGLRWPKPPAPRLSTSFASWASLNVIGFLIEITSLTGSMYSKALQRMEVQS